jgi:hypothetical protein
MDEYINTSDIYVESIDGINAGIKTTHSWANLINSELADSIEGKEIMGLSSSNTNTIFGLFGQTNKTTKQTAQKEPLLNTDEIMNIDHNIIFNELPDNKLLEYQMTVSSHLRKYFKGCNDKNEEINYDSCLLKLKWLIDVSKYFSDKLGLQCNPHKNITTSDFHTINRSSYKFCEYGHNCQFNYSNEGNKRGCFSQHYVHNLIYADMLSLYQYIIALQKCDDGQTNFIEIIKCINTISYVINHMFEELNELVSSDINPIIENIHKENVFKELRQKKSIKQKKKKILFS